MHPVSILLFVWTTGLFGTHGGAGEVIDVQSHFKEHASKYLRAGDDGSVRAIFQEGCYGSDCATQFKMPLAGTRAAAIGYDFKLGGPFPVRLDGKLPGVCGGKCNSGGHRSTGSGFSVRAMWHPHGCKSCPHAPKKTNHVFMSIYIYHQKQVTSTGDRHYFPSPVVVNKWHKLTLEVDLDSHMVRGTLNDQRAQGMIYVHPDIEVDKFFFSTFVGGLGEAPDTCWIDFRSFTLRTD